MSAQNTDFVNDLVSIDECQACDGEGWICRIGDYRCPECGGTGLDYAAVVEEISTPDVKRALLDFWWRRHVSDIQRIEREAACGHGDYVRPDLLPQHRIEVSRAASIEIGTRGG